MNLSPGVLKGLLVLGMLACLLGFIFLVISSFYSPNHAQQVNENRREYFVLECSEHRSYDDCQADSFKLYPKAVK